MAVKNNRDVNWNKELRVIRQKNRWTKGNYFDEESEGKGEHIEAINTSYKVLDDSKKKKNNRFLIKLFGSAITAGFILLSITVSSYIRKSEKYTREIKNEISYSNINIENKLDELSKQKTKIVSGTNSNYISPPYIQQPTQSKTKKWNPNMNRWENCYVGKVNNDWKEICN